MVDGRDEAQLSGCAALRLQVGWQRLSRLCALSMHTLTALRRHHKRIVESMGDPRYDARIRLLAKAAGVDKGVLTAELQTFVTVRLLCTSNGPYTT